jgi:hypothetical protein
MVPCGVKRPVLPTRGYRRLRPSADLPSIGLVAYVALPASPSAAATPQCGEKCGLLVFWSLDMKKARRNNWLRRAFCT